jgi:hypothetical protein
MPIETELLRNKPYAKEVCPKCGNAFPEFMRGQVQSAWRRWLGLGYCAVICERCRKVIGWERP